MVKRKKIGDIIIYQGPNGEIRLKGDFDKETIWANQYQIADIFGVDRTVITKHIKNIFKDQELDEKVVSAKFALTTKHGAIKGKSQTKEVVFYNLDVILAVGYRVNSKVATEFRKWATKVLKEHILQGYTINKNLLAKNYALFQKAISTIQEISQDKLSANDVLELIKTFSQTWFSLDAFDKSDFQNKKQTQKSVNLQAKKFYEDLEKLKKDLISKGQATELFAKEKENGTLEAIFGNVFQTAFGKDIYPSIELKASHLLYFIVKNHPFIDGNKRSGAFAFIWFLQKAKYKFKDKITPQALTAITLMIAISDPKDKQRMIDLVVLLLTGG